MGIVVLKKESYNDDLIIEALKRASKPLPPSTISFITKLSSSKVSQRLKQLQKYGIVKLLYNRVIPFYCLSPKNVRNQ